MSNNIDRIMNMIDWNNDASIQAAGIKMAEAERDIRVFIQPCTESYSKNVWDNCALILSKKSDAELAPYLSELFEWLQDMNWPGAFCILSQLKNYTEDDLFNSTLDTCLSRAKISADDVWWNNLHMLKNEKADTKLNL